MEENKEKINSKTSPWRRYIKRAYTTLQLCDFQELALQFTMCNWVTKLSWLDFSGWSFVPRRYQKPALPPSMTVPQRRRRCNYNSRAWHNQRIWYREHIYWWRTICRWLWWLKCVHSILCLSFFKIFPSPNIMFCFVMIDG